MMNYVFEQFRSPRGCLSYLIGDVGTKSCIIIDPSDEVGAAYEIFLKVHGLRLQHLIETHTHADHVSAAPALRATTGASLLMSERAPSTRKDRGLKDGDAIAVGNLTLTVMATPGHTDDSLTVRLGDILFTGDTLLIGSTGRTDFQNGSSERLYQSLWEKIMPLSKNAIVYPAHDYRGRSSTTIGTEQETNPRLKLSRQEFVMMMDSYHPPPPDLFQVALDTNSR